MAGGKVVGGTVVGGTVVGGTVGGAIVCSGVKATPTVTVDPTATRPAGETESTDPGLVVPATKLLLVCRPSADSRCAAVLMSILIRVILA